MGNFRRKASLLAWAVRDGGRWSSFSWRLAGNVWACWSMSLFVVRGKREESIYKKSKEERKKRKEIKRQKAHSAEDVHGGTYTHVGRTIDLETGTRAFEKPSRTPSYISIYMFMSRCASRKSATELFLGHFAYFASPKGLGGSSGVVRGPGGDVEFPGEVREGPRGVSSRVLWRPSERVIFILLSGFVNGVMNIDSFIFGWFCEALPGIICILMIV